MITEKEHMVIAQIARAEHSPVNGANPDSVEDCGTWLDCADLAEVPFECISGKSLAGVLSSLYSKDLARGDDESINLSKEGFKAFKEGPYGKLD